MSERPAEPQAPSPARAVEAPEPAGIALARRLADRKEEIERLFAHRLQQALPAAQREDRPTLLDHLPQLLDALGRELRASVLTEDDRRVDRALSRLHGEQRAHLPMYSIEQVLAEYRLFRKVIFEVLEREGRLRPRERDLILDFIQVGAKYAASQFLHVRVTQARILRWLPADRYTRYAVSVALVAVATGVEWLAHPYLAGSSYIAYYPMVVASAFVGDGLLVTALSAIVSQILFLSPDHSPALAWPDDYVRTGMFLFNGTLIAMVTRLMRRAQLTAHTAAREQELAKQEAEATSRKLAQEQELRGQFVATLTHDLRGPLNTIRLSAQRLLRYPEKTELRDQLQRRIIQGVDRVDEMVQNLLDVGRIRSGQQLPIHVGPADLAAVVRDILEELELAHGDRFLFDGPASLPGFWSATELRRLVENLCANALKYGSATEPIRVRLERRDPWVQLDVVNALANDHPLTAGELAAAFEPFHRTRTAQASGQKGWGLGLTLVKGIAEAHGGTVRAHSAVGHGTTFTVLLPLDARTRPEPELPH
ncbi:MAG TPA: HAMP domain-containing sensor histidine kinase [Myxococcaceae bacterium]|nr:HAMP domain-containing sensor histidine kinase [Myxococcaceae bacterium]